MRFLILIALLGCAESKTVQSPNVSIRQELNVLSINGVHIRAQPDPSAKSLVVVPYARIVSVSNITESPRSQFNGIPGYWRKAFAPAAGYVFDGFLSSLPAPPLACSSLRQYVDSAFPKYSKPELHSFTIRKDSLGKDTVVEIRPYTIPAHNDVQYFTVETLKLQNGGIFVEQRYWEGRNEELYLPDVTARDLLLVSRICVGSELRELSFAVSLSDYLLKPRCFSRGYATTVTLVDTPKPKVEHWGYYVCAQE